MTRRTRELSLPSGKQGNANEGTPFVNNRRKYRGQRFEKVTRAGGVCAYSIERAKQEGPTRKAAALHYRLADRHQLLKGGKKIFQNVGDGVANSTGTSEP